MSRDEKLTAKQEKVLGFIASYIESNGYPPSTRDIQNYFNFASPTAAVNYLRTLERKGRIRRDAKTARGIVILESR